MQLLRQSMTEWSRKLAAQNVSEEALVVIRRDRLCVPVKAGRQVLSLPLFQTPCSVFRLHGLLLQEAAHLLIVCRRRREKKRVYAVRRHDSSLCTEKQPVVCITYVPGSMPQI